ncbi:hypothetical protein HHI36_013015 [Cryptolaemus montrouzieri]|uniref:Uncharacterized protein n=1 Tax=Cryptolaemus montrouzieri TaxID=559131 RepID=A0ABD2NGK7_9CUCU
MQHGYEDIIEDSDNLDYEEERIEDYNHDGVRNKNSKGDVEGDLELGEKFRIYFGKDNETIWAGMYGVKGVNTYPGTDVGSDHNPVVANVSVRLKKKIINILKKNIDMQKLKDPEVQTKVKQRINKDFAALKYDATDDINVEEGWKQVKSKIINIEQEERPPLPMTPPENMIEYDQ